MTKSQRFICTILAGSISCFLAASSVSAHTYTTPHLATSTYQIHKIAWIIQQVTDSASVQVSYQTKVDPTDPDAWVIVGPDDCTLDGTTLTCTATIPTTDDTYLQLKIDYPDEAVLQTFNLNYSTPSTVASDTPAATSKLYYSDFKDLTDLQADKLSWKQVSLTDTPADRLIVQTRATADGHTWTDWQGNATLITDYSAADATTSATPGTSIWLAPGSLTLATLPEQDFDQVLVSYLDEHHLYTLTQPAATGDDEAEAFAHTSFYLNTLEGLHLGDTLQLREQIGLSTYTARGIITDLKDSDGLVTLSSFQGAIPNQAPSNCDGHSFCFSTSSLIQRIDQALFASAQATGAAQLRLYTDEAHTTPVSYTPQLDSVQLWQASAPDCLEYAATDSPTPFCKTAAVSLRSYYNNSTPQALQYRIFYGHTGDIIISDVFLHEYQAPTTPDTTATFRLRAGTIIDETLGRAIYWR